MFSGIMRCSSAASSGPGWTIWTRNLVIHMFLRLDKRAEYRYAKRQKPEKPEKEGRRSEAHGLGDIFTSRMV